jgi:hypothetical protein
LCASRKNQGHGKVGKLKQQLLTSSYSYVITGAAMLKTAETETAIDNQHLLKIAETAERKMSTGTASDVIAMTVNHTRGHAAAQDRQCHPTFGQEICSTPSDPAEHLC